MEFLKLAVAVWIGACLRNENDRKKTLELFNSLGVEAEKIVKGFFQGGNANHVQSTQVNQPAEDNQEFI